MPRTGLKLQTNLKVQFNTIMKFNNSETWSETIVCPSKSRVTKKPSNIFFTWSTQLKYRINQIHGKKKKAPLYAKTHIYHFENQKKKKIKKIDVGKEDLLSLGPWKST
jgi:hypothetical protein